MPYVGQRSLTALSLLAVIVQGLVSKTKAGFTATDTALDWPFTITFCHVRMQYNKSDACLRTPFTHDHCNKWRPSAYGFILELDHQH